MVSMAKLYRSRSDALLGGVCGGIGNHLGVDSNLVRLVFVLLALASGVGVLVYVLLWLIVPREGEVQATPQEAVRVGAAELAEKAKELAVEVSTVVRRPEVGAGIVIGTLLVVFGVLFLLRNLGVFRLWWATFDVLWPLILVVVGLALLWRFLRRG